MPGYMCSMCSESATPEQAVILITPLAGGETMPVGNDCMPVVLTGMLAGTIGIDADKLWAAVERLQRAKQDGQDSEPAAKPPGRRRRPAGAAAPPSEPPPPPDAGHGDPGQPQAASGAEVVAGGGQ